MKHGFRIITLHVYGKFVPLRALKHNIPGGKRSNLASASEYVLEIYRQILMSKERIRYIRHSLPFNEVPKLFMIDLVF